LPGPPAVRFDVRACCSALVANISATEARKRLYALIDEVGDSHQPVYFRSRGCANRSSMAWPHRQKSSAISPAGELERSPDSRLRRSCPSYLSLCCRTCCSLAAASTHESGRCPAVIPAPPAWLPRIHPVQAKAQLLNSAEL
jgi:hypothetical protein